MNPEFQSADAVRALHRRAGAFQVAIADETADSAGSKFFRRADAKRDFGIRRGWAAIVFHEMQAAEAETSHANRHRQNMPIGTMNVTENANQSVRNSIITPSGKFYSVCEPKIRQLTKRGIHHPAVAGMATTRMAMRIVMRHSVNCASNAER